MDSLPEKNVQLSELMPLFREQLAAGHTVRFGPRGTSMLPMLRQGMDQVVLSPLPDTLRKYDLPLYQRDNGQYVLHRIVKVETDGYICMGDNQVQPEAGVRRDQMIAVVSEFYRDGKRHRVTEPGYRFYCRVWYAARHLRRLIRKMKGQLRRLLK